MAQAVDKHKLEIALNGFSIPPRPELLIALQQEIDSGEPDVKYIGKLISQDIAIAGFLLKVVNSPVFARRQHIDSAAQACLVLGAEKILLFVRSILIRYQIGTQKADLFLDTLWDSSNKLAEACVAICQYMQLDFPDEAYTIGMFHNTGMAILYSKNADYPKVLTDAYSQELLTISEYEEVTYSVAHELLSFLVAESWGLSHEVCNVLAYHHSVNAIYTTGNYIEKEMLSVLKLAEHMLELGKWLTGYEVDYEWQRCSDAVLDTLEIELFQLPDIGEYLENLGIRNKYSML
ncbi:HDOD domain-containing protein [Catenovulum sediminis]|uniref:HDOD domain-containing protein n=1 Tax=Catenovulum sediminis TaxID=1740262 RepID=A0ABV1RNC3_9ALTE